MFDAFWNGVCWKTFGTPRIADALDSRDQADSYLSHQSAAELSFEDLRVDDVPEYPKYLDYEDQRGVDTLEESEYQAEALRHRHLVERGFDENLPESSAYDHGNLLLEAATFQDPPYVDDDYFQFEATFVCPRPDYYQDPWEVEERIQEYFDSGLKEEYDLREEAMAAHNEYQRSLVSTRDREYLDELVPSMTEINNLYHMDYGCQQDFNECAVDSSEIYATILRDFSHELYEEYPSEYPDDGYDTDE